MEYEIVIGLEVHIQLNTESKIFCGCSTSFDNPPNTNICPVCCGYPGVLPVFNKRALELGTRVGLALGCSINDKIYFERKNYFYPDLPKGYQISQYKLPLGEHGKIVLPSGKTVGVTRVHLEEDAGKSVHKPGYSLVDLNRTGVALMEIVSEPDMRSPQEAFDYLSLLKLTVQYVGASTCDMEKGYLRCDANISVRKLGETELGTKVELKNMNSFKGVRDALEYEAKRQIKCLNENKEIFQETRLWDESKRKTVTMRTKEASHDYRYFPDPDLVDYIVEKSLVEEERKNVGELPLAKKERFIKSYDLTEKEIDVLISLKHLADFFEQSAKVYNEPKPVVKFLLGPFLEAVNSLQNQWDDVKISADNFAKIVHYFNEKKINNLAAKKILSLSITTNKDCDAIIKEESLTQVSDEGELLSFVREAVKNNPKPVEEFLKGKQQAIMFIVGQIMKRTKGKANPKVVRDLIEKEIKN